MVRRTGKYSFFVAWMIIAHSFAEETTRFTIFLDIARGKMNYWIDTLVQRLLQVIKKRIHRLQLIVFGVHL